MDIDNIFIYNTWKKSNNADNQNFGANFCLIFSFVFWVSFCIFAPFLGPLRRQQIARMTTFSHTSNATFKGKLFKQRMCLSQFTSKYPLPEGELARDLSVLSLYNQKQPSTGVGEVAKFNKFLKKTQFWKPCIWPNDTFEVYVKFMLTCDQQTQWWHSAKIGS